MVLETTTIKQNIIVPTRTILHPLLGVITIRYVQDIPKHFCYGIQVKKSIQGHPISITDTDYDHILDEIESNEKLSLNGI